MTTTEDFAQCVVCQGIVNNVCRCSCGYADPDTDKRLNELSGNSGQLQAEQQAHIEELTELRRLVPSVNQRAALDAAIAALAARQPVGVESVVRQSAVAWYVFADTEHWVTLEEDEAEENAGDGCQVRPLIFGDAAQPQPAAVPVDSLREPLLRLISAGEYLQNRILSTNGANCVDQFEFAIDAAKSALDTHPQPAAAKDGER